MKQLLRLLLSRKQYRALRTAMRTADAVSESADETTVNQSTDTSKQHTKPVTTRQQLANNPNIPTDRSLIETPSQFKAVLQEMDPYEFEYFVADLWEKMGWETTVSAETADRGIDVTARKSTPYDQLVLIQAKRYGPDTTVGSPDIQQYASLKHQQDGVDKVIVVTTNDYTRQARELADSLNVKLIDGDGLVALVDEYKAHDLVAKYLDFIELSGMGDKVHADVRAETQPTADQSEDEIADTANATDAVDTTDATTDATATNTADSDTTAVDTDQPKTTVESTVWHKLVAASTLGWGVLFVGAPAMSDAVLSLLFLSAWVGLPVGIYLDSRRLPESWPKRTWIYVLGSLIWFLAVVPGVVYLWRRRSVGRD